MTQRGNEMNAKHKLGHQHGYFGSVVSHPDCAEYMAGYNAGYAMAEKEYWDTLPDTDYHLGSNDANYDCNHC